MGRRMLSVAVIALISALMLAFSGCSSEDGATSTPEGQGTISGSLSIGPLCPVEPCTVTVNPYTGLQVVVSAGDDEIAVFDVDDEGSFSGVAPPGDYQVDVRPCVHLGCQFELPVSVSVRDGETSTLELEIDTGIR